MTVHHLSVLPGQSTRTGGVTARSRMAAVATAAAGD